MAIKKKVVEVDTAQATTSVKELRQQLKLLKDQMLSTTQGTDEYNQAMRQAADIMHTLKEQQEELNASAMDFGQIASNTVKATGGLVAGLQAAKATMSLFGVENEEVLKSLQRMQNLMAITQALPSLDAGFKAFKRLGLIIKSATAGLHGFKAALVSTGIGALVVAIGLLVAYWDDLTAAITGTNKALEEQARLNEEERLKKVNDQLEKRLGLEKEIRKAGGQDDLKIAEEQVKTIQKEIKNKEASVELSRRDYAQKLMQISAAQQQGKAESYINGLRQEANDLATKEKNLEADIKSIKEGKLKLAEEELKKEKLLAEARKIKEEQEEKEKELEERRKKAIEQAEKLRQEYEKLVVEVGNYNKTQKELDIQKLNKEEEERIKLISKAEKNQVIREQRITAVHEHYEQERKKIEDKYAQQAIKDTQEQAFAELALLENNYKLQQAALQASLDDQEIDLIQFNERKKELDEAYKEDYISTLQALLEDETLNTEQRLELYEKLNEFRNPEKKEDKEDTTNEPTTADGITEAINASALALSEFSDNPAWGKVLQNLAIISSNWDEIHTKIEKGGAEAFSAYADLAAAALSAVGAMMNGLAAEQDQSNQKGFESAKNFQIAGATMSMLAGIASAWSSSMQLPFPANVIVGSILSAMMLGVGIAQIVKIKQQKFKSSGASGSNASPASGAVANLTAPVQYTQDVQGANIEGAIKDQRVVVVESDITDTQNKVEVTESEAKF